MTSLLVASGGGHLSQLGHLRSRLAAGPSLVVSYEPTHVLASLAREPFVAAYHPTTKNVPNAVRNYRLARKVFREHEIDRVISTGAALAVPFLLRARQLGIPCHYIESATRVAGPSLSGKLLEMVPGVHLYRQHGDWGGARWQQGPCVFDDFDIRANSVDNVTLHNVVVSLGTHHFPFPRLVRRVLASAPGELAITWQLGSTPATNDLPGRVVHHLPSDELANLFSNASAVVGHAGVGLTLTALAAGKVPVLVPRRRSQGEHTDDHQVQLAKALEERGLAVTAEVEELSIEHLHRAASLQVVNRIPPPFELLD